MDEIRKIKFTLKSRPTIEGAGVRLKRAFGNDEPLLFDPFLLLDHFGSENPKDYMAGFPWHPHRGIETITYMIQGDIKHEDSLGNGGVISSGDVQWMTAGSGIIHQEMPQKSDNFLLGFQLWANLPASNKMMDPRYRDVKKEQIPIVKINEDVEVRIICGEFNGIKGPVQDIVTEPEYLDVTISPNSEFKHLIRKGKTALAYVFEGDAFFDENKDPKKYTGQLIVFGDGNEVKISTSNNKVRFLLISGNPIKEPIAWHGPIVMNTKEELRIAFEEYQNGTFCKIKK